MTGPNRPLTPAEMAAVAEVQKLTREAAKATKAERDRVRDDNEKVDRRVTEAQVRAIVGPPYPPETADEFRDISSHHMRVKGAVYTRGADMIAATVTEDPDDILDLARGVERAAARTEPQGLVEHGAADQLPSIYLTARAKEQEVLGGVMQYPQTLRALRVMDPDKDFSHHGHVARAITSLADRKEAFGPDAVMSELKTMNVRQPVVRSDGTTQLHDWADGACLPGHALMAAEDLRTIRIARETEDIGKWLQQASRGAVDDTGVRLERFVSWRARRTPGEDGGPPAAPGPDVVGSAEPPEGSAAGSRPGSADAAGAPTAAGPIQRTQRYDPGPPLMWMATPAQSWRESDIIAAFMHKGGWA